MRPRRAGETIALGDDRIALPDGRWLADSAPTWPVRAVAGATTAA
jgi:hypothetical protein